MSFGQCSAKGEHIASHVNGRARGVAAVLEARRGGVIVVLSLIAMGLAMPTVASEDRCTSWFPDFTCDREARPAGHIAPMSMPYLFEDPYITTELNLVGIYHNFPADSIFDGGGAGIIALQARLAITDRLAFIATKDGYMIMRNDNVLLDNEEGFMDVTVGFKYALIDHRESSLIVTPSLRYEIPLGNDGVFQGTGKGVIIPALSVGYGPGATHLIVGIGSQLAVDGDKDSSSLFYNIHLDQAFEVGFVPGADFIVPFIELNGTTYLDSGDGKSTIETDAGRLPIGVVQRILHSPNPFMNPTADLRGEGADVANLGSSGMAGESVITMAWGVRIPFRSGFSTGLSYERVLSRREDIFEQRVTLMLSYGF